MTGIERRRATVTLYPGNFEHELTDLMNRTMEAQRAEETSGQQRAGTRSKAIALAREYDKHLETANASGVEVTVWAISYTHWGRIADKHPPREDNAEDIKRGVNMKTFPLDLLRASLVAPGEATDFDDLTTKGVAALDELGDLSRVHYAKIESAAWNVNVGDDALPKFSLVSLLKQAREPGSKEPNDSE